jgi:hypothetical protein
MDLIVQPEDGLAPLMAAVKSAKASPRDLQLPTWPLATPINS